MKKIDLLVIDPQIDFCDPKGALYVNGAEKDMDRLASFIDREGSKINEIHVTLDSHHYLDVAHPIFWRNSQGEHPNIFTIISYDDVKNGVWMPTIAQFTKDMLNYVKALQDGGRYPLCIWPPHCLIGSPGHAVYPSLFASLIKWENRPRVIDYVTKGSNILTENYSIVKAEVPDPSDPTTQINARLVNTLQQSDLVIICGEAGSHCVANSVKDIASAFLDDSYIQKLVLLTDCISPVTGFENLQEDFIKEMTKRGLQLATTSSLRL
jgi:nicotinamidase-related amidase